MVRSRCGASGRLLRTGPSDRLPGLCGLGRPGRGRGVVRVGRHRGEDRTRPGFPLPVIWPSLRLDTAIILPIGQRLRGVLCAWLSREQSISAWTRRFASWSAMAAIALGMAGRVAYPLMAQAGMTPGGAVADHNDRVLPACLPACLPAARSWSWSWSWPRDRAGACAACRR